MTHRLPPTTVYCGYCNAAYTPDRACRCPESRRAQAARRAELAARLAPQRDGVAELPTFRPRGEWRS